MPVVINGSGTVTGLAVGGLPDGTVDADTLASGATVVLKKTYYEIPRGTFTNTDNFPNDDTVPQYSEGALAFSQAYTPTNTSGAYILVTTHFHVGETANECNSMKAGLFLSNSTDALQVRSAYHAGESEDASTGPHNVNMTIIHKLPTWSGERTFSLVVSGGDCINYQHYQHESTAWADDIYSAEASKSAFIVEEIAT